MPAATQDAYKFILKLRGQVAGSRKSWLAKPVPSRTVVSTSEHHRTQSTLTKAEIEITAKVVHAHWRAEYSSDGHGKPRTSWTEPRGRFSFRARSAPIAGAFHALFAEQEGRLADAVLACPSQAQS